MLENLILRSDSFAVLTAGFFIILPAVVGGIALFSVVVYALFLLGCATMGKKRRFRR